ncbi:MAG: GatB/YqeY domain-containing protein [Chitinophagales bacterium]
MTLEEKVITAMKLAMKTKQAADLRGLRAIKSAIMLVKTEKDFNGTLSEEKEIALLQKMIKQRKESLKIYQEQNREELAQKELEEIEVIDQFLPAQLSEEEISAKIDEIIAQTGASSMKDMGKVMGMTSKIFAGTADNSLVSKIVRAKLG